MDVSGDAPAGSQQVMSPTLGQGERTTEVGVGSKELLWVNCHVPSEPGAGGERRGWQRTSYGRGT